MRTKDGGLAFPSNHREANGTAYESSFFEPGMTLRDYFAANAIGPIIEAMESGEPSDDWRLKAAKMAYEVADTMLDVREAES